MYGLGLDWKGGKLMLNLKRILQNATNATKRSNTVDVPPINYESYDCAENAQYIAIRPCHIVSYRNTPPAAIPIPTTDSTAQMIQGKLKTSLSKGKGKGSCLKSRLHDNACSTAFTFPMARWEPMQPVTVDPTLDLCTRYILQLGGPRQCGIRSLPNTSTHGQHWESNSWPSDLESSALSTRPHAPTFIIYAN